MQFREFIQRKTSFVFLVQLFLALVVLNAILRFVGVFIPIALLFGPLHFCLHGLSKGKTAKPIWLLHLIPFIIVLVVFPRFHGSLYLFLLMISTAAYSFYVWLNKGNLQTNSSQKLMVLQTAAVSSVGSVFIALLFLSSVGILSLADVGFDASYVVYGLLLVIVTIQIGFLVNDDKAVQKGLPKYFNYQIDHEVLQSYASRIESAISDKKLYLNAALSMDDLLRETGIPKHHLSRVFTIHLRKTFYQYIAEKRIEEAKKRMEKNANITIEFLAFECGFNSKTTFNKYFKQIASVTPSEYRATLNSNS